MAVTTLGPLPSHAGRRLSPLTEQAYTQMRDAIAALLLQPGQPLTEASLSEWLGTGRTPVREALIRLKDDGLVESVPRKGYFVSRISADDAQEIYEMLEGLEGIAAKLAAERATQDDTIRLEEAIHRQEKALGEGNMDEWVAADEAIHGIILDIARNPGIRRAVDALNVRIRRLRLFTIQIRPKPVDSTRDHRAELEAIRAGDGQLARKIRQEHWERARVEMVGLIRRHVGPAGAI